MYSRSGVALAALAGVVVALSLPPWGWWPLGFVGIAALSVLLAGRAGWARFRAGAAFGVGMFTVGLWWMGEFNAVGAGLAVIVEAMFIGLAGAAAPPGRARAMGLPAALVLAEGLRRVVPFGGLPLAGIALGQVGGPLAGAARIGGELSVMALAAGAGVALACLARRDWRPAALAMALVAGVAVAGAAAPDGSQGRAVVVGAVQGGGPRGFRGVDADAGAVFAAHLASSDRLRPPLDLVLWPEDVVDVDRPIAATHEAEQLGALARGLGAPVVAGVVEDAGPTRFRNAAVVWSAAGVIADRYDKVHRVPFGEYVPWRSLVDRVADLSVIPRDAIAGGGPGVVATSAGQAGVLISYEVFFADRARTATEAGGTVLLVPTNAASFSTSQVPTQEVAAARLRAIESGRSLVQAAPTGYSAFIDHRGRVLARSTLGRGEVIQRPVTLRTGRTIYHRTGDWPVLALAALALGLAWRRASPASLALEAV